MDGKKNRGKTAKNTGTAIKVPVVQLGADLDHYQRDRQRIRQASGRPSSADYDGPRAGWWTVTKSTGSPYLMDQRFPLRFGSSQYGAHSPRTLASRGQQRGDSHQHPVPSGQFKGKSRQPPTRHSQQRAGSQGAAGGAGKPQSQQSMDRDTDSEAGRPEDTSGGSHDRDHILSRSNSIEYRQHVTENASFDGRFPEPEDLEHQYSTKEREELNGKALGAYGQKNPRQRNSGQDTTFFRYYNHDEASRMNPENLENHDTAPPNSDDERSFTRGPHDTISKATKWHRNDTGLRFPTDDISFTRSQSFDVKIAVRTNGRDYYRLTKRHSDDEILSTLVSEMKTNVLSDSTTKMKKANFYKQSASSAPFYKAAINLMQAQHKKASRVQNASSLTPRGADLQLQKLRQQFLEAQQRPPQFQPIQPRPVKQQRYGSAHRPTKQPPKSILRYSTGSAREGRQLSPAIQRGMSLYIEKLLVLSGRSEELPRQHTTHAETVDASRLLSPRPQKRVTFGDDVVFDIRPDVGMTGRVLRHLSH